MINILSWCGLLIRTAAVVLLLVVVSQSGEASPADEDEQGQVHEQEPSPALSQASLVSISNIRQGRDHFDCSVSGARFNYFSMYANTRRVYIALGFPNGIDRSSEMARIETLMRIWARSWPDRITVIRYLGFITVATTEGYLEELPNMLYRVLTTLWFDPAAVLQIENSARELVRHSLDTRYYSDDAY